MRIFSKLLIAITIFFFSSCAALFNQPLKQKPSRTGELAPSTKILLDLPKAKSPLEVAVYNFSDQTGQYKAVENGSTFSTAVSQGATTILIKALEDSGWFIPIERENLSNLSTERNIIRNTKQEYIKNLNPNEPPLPPLLYAGLLLEGGIISYDTNIITGGVGARYFGIGGSTQYRQDRITVYLRAVSTSNGQILKTVYVSKTILSQALDASLFRFVKFQRLLEIETGITQNEPMQLAVKDAIEKAVHDLVIEGIKDQYWGTEEGVEKDKLMVDEYLKIKAEDENTELYDRKFVVRDLKNSLNATGSIGQIFGDYTQKNWDFFTSLEYQRKVSNTFGVGVLGSYFKLNNGEVFDELFYGLDLNGSFNVLPNDEVSPYVYFGPGVIFRNSKENKSDYFVKAQVGVGVMYFLSPRWAIKAFAEYDFVFSDEVDYLINGKRDDHYYNFGIGINYYFNFNK
jgi:curli production assembly/transport component CsgG